MKSPAAVSNTHQSTDKDSDEMKTMVSSREQSKPVITLKVELIPTCTLASFKRNGDR